MKHASRLTGEYDDTYGNSRAGMSPKATLRSFASDPMSALHKLHRKRKKLSNGYREEIRNLACDVYELAFFLWHNDDAWERLCRDEFWHDRDRIRPKNKTPHAVLSACFWCFWGPSQKDARRKISKYVAYFEPPFRHNRSPQEVRKEILEAKRLDIFREKRPLKREETPDKMPPIKFCDDSKLRRRVRMLMKEGDQFFLIVKPEKNALLVQKVGIRRCG